jgi:hypothetical protein
MIPFIHICQVREGEGAEAQGEEGDQEGQHGQSTWTTSASPPASTPFSPASTRRPRCKSSAGPRAILQVARLGARHGQPSEDVRDHGPVRVTVRQHGGAGRVHGGLHGRIHLPPCPRLRSTSSCSRSPTTTASGSSLAWRRLWCMPPLPPRTRRTRED